MRLSVLDQSAVVTGRPAADSIRESLSLARHAEALGYHRYWVAEHHNSAAIAGSAPEILIAAIAATTTRIRVGSAGVMLPHYASLKVAEQFRVLEAIAPGRIDLGVGRAPGGDGLTAHALNPNAATAADRFPAQLRDLLAWVSGEKLMENHPFRDVVAMPSGAGGPELWMLGSSGYGAQLAAHSACHTALPISSPTDTARPRRWICTAPGISRAGVARPPGGRYASGRWRRTRRRQPSGSFPAGRCGGWAAIAASMARCPRPRRRRPMRIPRPSGSRWSG